MPNNVASLRSPAGVVPFMGHTSVQMQRPMGWDRVALCYTLIIGVPTILYYYLRLGGANLMVLHGIVATFYLITSSMIILETTVALCRRFAVPTTPPATRSDALGRRLKTLLGWRGARRPEPTEPMPRASLIIPAYLPNEQEIIVETLLHALNRVRRPRDGFEVILAYNSPVSLPVERELQALQAQHPNLVLLRVAGSESKAENLNAAIDIANGDIAAILDADHLPRPDCLERAWRWLSRGYDVVQGRSVVRNFDDNWATRCIAVEFECMYGISHPARSLWLDTAIFGGSNGYWRMETLRRVRFDAQRMTEDIDASVRALAAGHRIVADRSIVSTELAVRDFRSFWFQRKRWAQGWLQVSLKHQGSLWKTRHLNLGQKLYWTYLLGYRELYPIVSLQIFPILFSLLLFEGAFPLRSHWYLWVSALITLSSGPYQAIVAARNNVTGFRGRHVAGYAFFVFFYVMLKHMIWIVALFDHLAKNNHWIVTRRQMSADLERKAEKNGVLGELHRMVDVVRNHGRHPHGERRRARAG
jgi:cellulose synthase/poly-beta-1,6-N-acetylglucosamine synthase-like glycosyltransferase